MLFLSKKIINYDIYHIHFVIKCENKKLENKFIF